MVLASVNTESRDSAASLSCRGDFWDTVAGCPSFVGISHDLDAVLEISTSHFSETANSVGKQTCR